MMTSSNWNIFRVTDPLCGELTGLRWTPRTKASDAELLCFLWSALNKLSSKQWWGWWFETPSRPLWRHCNVIKYSPSSGVLYNAYSSKWVISIFFSNNNTSHTSWNVRESNKSNILAVSWRKMWKTTDVCVLCLLAPPRQSAISCFSFAGSASSALNISWFKLCYNR